MIKRIHFVRVLVWLLEISRTCFMLSQSMPSGRLKSFRGGCLCGAIRYEASGQPYNITHCHCLDCRRSSGAPFVTWASFRRNEFRFVRGRPRKLRWAGRQRSFCPQCGAALTFMSGPDEIDVTVCSLDNAGRVLPADHTWTEDRLPWIRLADNLPAYRRKRQIKAVGSQPRSLFVNQSHAGRSMTSTRQRSAARRNIKKAAAAAKRKRTVAHLPKSTRTALGREGAKAARSKRRHRK